MKELQRNICKIVFLRFSLKKKSNYFHHFVLSEPPLNLQFLRRFQWIFFFWFNNNQQTVSICTYLLFFFDLPLPRIKKKVLFFADKSNGSYLQIKKKKKTSGETKFLFKIFSSCATGKRTANETYSPLSRKNQS